MAARRQRLFVLNDPHALRISGELAVEIGFNESIVLLQLEYLLSISEHEREGRVWTYQSLQELKEHYFPWWSVATIGRVIKRLEELELISIGHFNRAGYDRTQWFALNPVGLKRLRSLRLEGATPISQIEKSISHAARSTSHPAKSISQPATTIPETTAETPTENENQDQFVPPKTLKELEAWERKHAERRRWIEGLESFRRDRSAD